MDDKPDIVITNYIGKTKTTGDIVYHRRGQ